jgi:hypothetical protein
VCHLQESDLGAITGCATSVATLAERSAIPQMLSRLSEELGLLDEHHSRCRDARVLTDGTAGQSPLPSMVA